ncbi:MAG: hypothetical protein AABX74_03615, partial [Nanoarchaeota archaeon]
LFLMLVVSFIFIIGCVQEEEKSNTGLTERIEKTPDVSANQGLGNLCSGKDECITFCHDNKGRCTQYCEDNPDNNLCAAVFPFQATTGDSELCQGAKIRFDHAPVNLEETELFLPLGLMAGGHVTPIDHHYFQNFANTEADIEVYSPGDGVVNEIQHMPGAPAGKDYRVVIQHTCTISSIFIHIEVLAEKLAAQAPENFAGVDISVKAGEIIGWYKTNVDFNLVDTDVTLSGFVIPEHYKEQDPWKIHVPNTYEYFNEPIKSKLLEKSVRTIESRAGKIDYDIDGRLSGNWFEEGSNGYAGKIGEEYWESHLSFAYDFMDPSLVIVSMADFKGKPNQYAVKGNFPDPAEIDRNSGMAKYELVSWGYTTENGQEWDKTKLAKVIKATAGVHVDGTVLVQMLEDRKIQFEAFPEKTASQVNGFTENAKIYER